MKPRQLNLNIENYKGKSATHSGGRGELFHDWLPYLEGFSSEFVIDIISQRFNKPKSIFPEPTEECPSLPKVTPVGTTDSKNVHAIENVSLETIQEHFEDMFQDTSAWQKGFTLEEQVI